MTRIEGASPEQRVILEGILAGIADVRLQALRVEPEYDLEPERDENDNPPADWDPETPLGDALRLIEPEWPDPRTQWELELVGETFHRAALAAGLGPIIAVHSAQSGSYFWNGDGDTPEAPAREQVDGGIQVAASTTGALLDRVEFLEPGGLAVAVSLAVPEPHGFLRHGLDAFVQLSGLTDRSLAGSFVLLEDGEPEPVVELFGRGGFGAQANRRDVECCVGGGLSRSIDNPGPPPCPFPSRTWEDMFEAFRRDLPRSTGRDLDAWRGALAEQALTTSWDRVRWLQGEGLGLARAYAIATA